MFHHSRCLLSLGLSNGLKNMCKLLKLAQGKASKLAKRVRSSVFKDGHCCFFGVILLKSKFGACLQIVFYYF